MITRFIDWLDALEPVWVKIVVFLSIVFPIAFMIVATIASMPAYLFVVLLVMLVCYAWYRALWGQK